MASLLYCIRYPVKPFLVPPSGFLLLRSLVPSLRPRVRPASPPPHLASVSFIHSFSHRSITGRIRARSKKLESRDQPLSSIRQGPPRPAQRCARADRCVISCRANRLLHMSASHSANRARQPAISDQTAQRRPQRILQRRRRAPNRNRPHAPRPFSRSHSASPRRTGPRLQ